MAEPAVAPSIDIPKRHVLWIVIGSVALALAARAPGLDDRPLWLDEAYSLWFSGRSWYELWMVVPSYETHPPVYYSILKLWRSIAGSDPTALRALSLAFGVLGAVLACMCAQEMERARPSPRPALRLVAAGLAMAIGPHLVIIGQEARPYPVLTAAYALALLGVLRLSREFTGDRPRGSVASWAILGLGTLAVLWLHALGLIYAFCLFLAMLWLVQRAHRVAVWRRFAATVALVGLAYLPCAWMIFFRAGDWGAGWLRWDPGMLAGLVPLYLVPASAGSVIGFIAMVPLFLLAIMAVRLGLRPDHRTSGEPLLLLLWLGPPLAVAAISALVMPVFLLRTLVPTLVPCYLLYASALAQEPSRLRRLFVGMFAAIALLFAGIVLQRRPVAEPWDEVAAYLATTVAPRDEVWIYPNDSALPLGEADPGLARRFVLVPLPAPYPATEFGGPIRSGSPAVPSMTLEQAQHLVEGAHGIPVIWLLSRQSEVFDPDGDLVAALSAERSVGEAREWGYISVTPYRRRDAPAPAPAPAAPAASTSAR